MSVPDAAVGFLLENLSQTLTYNHHLIVDAKENVQTLRQELETLKGLMKDYKKYNHDSDYLKELVNEIRNIVDEAEDAVDTYLVQAAVQKSQTWIKKAFHIFDYPKKLRDVGLQIEKVSTKIRDMNQDKVRNGFEVLQHQAIARLNQTPAANKEAPTVEEEHVVGFDGAAEAVSKLLTGGPQHFEAISIVGMLGLGKTTLAKKVFKDPNVDYEYMIRAFVYVSKEYEKREVLLKILSSFAHLTDEVNKMSDEQLEKYVYNQLEGKQYLIVLDDIWEKEDWNILKRAFPNNDKRCRVLITTRHVKVAEYANPRGEYYKLDFLPFDKSQELLRWKVFENNCCPDELQEYEVKILEKCDGLPLAIVVIAELDTYRRLCINNVNVPEYISERISGKRVRSFLTFAKEETTVELNLVSSIPRAFKLLRVLEMQSLIFTRFPAELCNLVLLKYVAISSNFSSLPPAMSCMWNMQTLIVNTTSRRLEIKADIRNMPQLRHLHTNASTTLFFDPKHHKSREDAFIGKNLQTLSTISPESCKREIFEMTPKIKKLGICGTLSKLFKVSGESSLFGSLRKLESLENLKLLNDDITSTLYSLPSEKSFPKQLSKLTLQNTLLGWSEMSTLGKLEKLEVLKLKDNAFQGKLWQTEKGGFLRLKHLYIGRTDLVSWEASVDHFPKLRSLELNNCDKLKAFPHGLADIPTLQMVVLHCTNPSVASTARRLQVLKLAQAQKSNKNSGFKLSIYPPEH
ncbi:OLC1v1032351C1 [Oldenlandia corymbosa var. corymbosa]|uniref:OLC1v1032351C1 n=1 Tax=Oldenlandia corymbosa var. corymbosa TaxID=529605 RepID=A0AAV1CP03_OLDCO|nr:OLC1v1032351C1 [Oldenlandia corymbosa var. corymbosa]